MYFIKPYRRGIFNKYYKGMPVFEMLLKDVNHAVLLTKNWFQNGFKSKVLLAYPHYPSRGSTMYKVARLLGFVVTNRKRRQPDAAVYWEYATYRKEFDFLESISHKVPVVNLQSRDLSKRLVENVSQQVFGYGTFVDPLTYTGKIVKKNDINAMHDGKAIQAPVRKIEEGFIYQRLIDNTASGDRVVDIRVVVVEAVLDFVYIKYRWISDRFKNPIETLIKPLDEVFSKEEIRLLNEYCRAVKLDFGEMDVLRDNNDKRIYVIDVNNTPQGPPSHISKSDGKYALRKIAEAYKRAFLLTKK
jgi:hypothetical protein